MNDENRITLRLEGQLGDDVRKMYDCGDYKNFSVLLRELIELGYKAKTNVPKEGETGIQHTIVFSKKDNIGLQDMVEKHQMAIDVPDAVRMCVKEYLQSIEDGTCIFLPKAEEAHEKPITYYL